MGTRSKKWGPDYGLAHRGRRPKRADPARRPAQLSWWGVARQVCVPPALPDPAVFKLLSYQLLVIPPNAAAAGTVYITKHNWNQTWQASRPMPSPWFSLIWTPAWWAVCLAGRRLLSPAPAPPCSSHRPAPASPCSADRPAPPPPHSGPPPGPHPPAWVNLANQNKWFTESKAVSQCSYIFIISPATQDAEIQCHRPKIKIINKINKNNLFSEP